jgi:hypothetical protein
LKRFKFYEFYEFGATVCWGAAAGLPFEFEFDGMFGVPCKIGDDLRVIGGV